MLAYTGEALGIIARHYMDATGASAVRLGLLIAANQRLIQTLLAGGDCTTTNALAASDFFDLSWPTDLAWPEGVPRRSIKLAGRPRPFAARARKRRSGPPESERELTTT